MIKQCLYIRCCCQTNEASVRAMSGTPRGEAPVMHQAADQYVEFWKCVLIYCRCCLHTNGQWSGGI